MALTDQELQLFSNDVFLAFREQQQRVHGNIGCRCYDCHTDMKEAVKKIISEGNFEVVLKRPQEILQPQSLRAAKAEGIAQAMSERDPVEEAEEELEMESPLNSKRYGPHKQSQRSKDGIDV